MAFIYCQDYAGKNGKLNDDCDEDEKYNCESETKNEDEQKYEFDDPEASALANFFHAEKCVHTLLKKQIQPTIKVVIPVFIPVDILTVKTS